MTRKLTLALAFLFALNTHAQRGHVVGRGVPIPGTTASGVVTAVNGNIISLAGGLVTIDASNAKISGDDGAPIAVSAIKAGEIVFAVLSSATVADNAPLPATIIGVISVPQVTLGGPVQSVDPTHNTLVVLGRTITVDDHTSFGGPFGLTSGLSGITAGDIVQVQADANAGNTALVATSVLVYAPMHKPALVIHGTVKSIGTDSWVITDRANKDWTVVINAQTKIAGDPKAGDPVDVLVNTDSANRYVAVSIMKSGMTPPPHETELRGVVKSISTTSWVIGPPVGLGPDYLVLVNANTKIVGDPRVGDHVKVIAEMSAGGLVAISITKE